MVPRDLNIGFQGLALIQGQIYNPVFGFRNKQASVTILNYIDENPASTIRSLKILGKDHNTVDGSEIPNNHLGWC